MEVLGLLVIVLVAWLVLTTAGAWMISLGVLFVVGGMLPWWVLVLAVGAVLLMPESAQERRTRAQEIETDRVLREAHNG